MAAATYTEAAGEATFGARWLDGVAAAGVRTSGLP